VTLNWFSHAGRHAPFGRFPGAVAPNWARLGGRRGRSGPAAPPATVSCGSHGRHRDVGSRLQPGRGPPLASRTGICDVPLFAPVIRENGEISRPRSPLPNICFIFSRPDFAPAVASFPEEFFFFLATRGNESFEGSRGRKNRDTGGGMFFGFAGGDSNVGEKSPSRRTDVIARRLHNCDC
jgi:hypothetical protein